MTSMKNVLFLHSPLPYFLSVRMGPKWTRSPPPPGRRNLGYQPPPHITTPPIPFGILAKKNYWKESEAHTRRNLQ